MMGEARHTLRLQCSEGFRMDCFYVDCHGTKLNTCFQEVLPVAGLLFFCLQHLSPWPHESEVACYKFSNTFFSVLSIPENTADC